MDISDLAVDAVNAMLMRIPMTITHPEGWQRPENWPLPIEKVPLAADGTRTQTYRPMAIIEYVERTFASAEKAERVKEARNE